MESTHTQGLQGAGFAVPDISRMRRRLERLGIRYTDSNPHPLAAARNADADIDSTRLQPDADQLRGLRLSFVQQTAPPAAAAAGLDHVVIKSADAEGTAFLLAAQLGLDLRMDLSREDWNSRLLFFRAGDLIVEVFQPLSGSGGRTDHFYGLTWRVPDIDAARERLTAAGFDISPVRRGRKPGTRVLTVRERTAQVPTLLLELSPQP